jgi:hypothetical protein
MIEVERVFRAQDGQLFAKLEEAEDYERQSVKDWLERNPQIDIAEILEEADDKNQNEYYSTDRDIVMEVVHRAWARRRNTNPCREIGVVQ